MRIALISRDEGLQRVCREILAAAPFADCVLEIAGVEAKRGSADVYIWDWEAGMQFPENPAHAHLLLVSREEARQVAEALPAGAVTLALKPANPDTLRGFLEQAVARDGLRQDRDAILDSLIETSLRLQEYDQDRMNFLARAVHDFRTPLTAVNGYCGMLLSGQLGPLTMAQQEVLERTLHSIRRLGRLATALFQWSSGARVGMRSEIREGDVEECCRQALYEIRPLAEEKNIAVDLDLRPPDGALFFDPAQMEQLLVNLLENSCKFTPRGGYIKVRGCPEFWERRAAAVKRDGFLIERRATASRRPNAYRLEVSDNGMGVRPEHLQSIFQEYTQYGGGSDRSGSGLGLAICKRILAEHGGSIFAESGNKGVTFVCLLPLARQSDGDADRGIHLVAETVGEERA